MKISSEQFKGNARAQLADEALQSNLRRFGGGFAERRRDALVKVDDFEALRDRGASIRAEVLENLDYWLLKFEAEAQRMRACSGW
jgi:L-lactate dehydrogenase complex protein LldF